MQKKSFVNVLLKKLQRFPETIVSNTLIVIALTVYSYSEGIPYIILSMMTKTLPINRMLMSRETLPENWMDRRFINSKPTPNPINLF